MPTPFLSPAQGSGEWPVRWEPWRSKLGTVEPGTGSPPPTVLSPFIPSPYWGQQDIILKLRSDLSLPCRVGPLRYHDKARFLLGLDDFTVWLLYSHHSSYQFVCTNWAHCHFKNILFPLVPFAHVLLWLQHPFIPLMHPKNTYSSFEVWLWHHHPGQPMALLPPRPGAYLCSVYFPFTPCLASSLCLSPCTSALDFVSFLVCLSH